MCVANLNVSTQPCAHRWYHLKRPCNPAHNLANCPERLQLEGWETRVNTCPFCSGAEHHQSTHRLFGSSSSASSVISSPTMGPSNRRGSGGSGTSNGLSPLDRQSSNSSLETDHSQRAREMNERMHIYLALDPHEVLPSARKNYPTYATAIARVESNSSSQEFYNPRESFSRGWKRMSGKVNAGLFKIT